MSLAITVAQRFGVELTRRTRIKRTFFCVACKQMNVTMSLLQEMADQLPGATGEIVVCCEWKEIRAPMLRLRENGRSIGPRERQVLELVNLLRGNNRAIALQLGLKYQTVKNHLAHLFVVTGAQNRMELIEWREEHRREGI